MFHTVGGQAGRVGVQLLTGALLARLLSPADFGWFAVIATLIGVVQIVVRSGTDTAAIQAAEFGGDRCTQLFWRLQGRSWFAAVSVVAVASWFEGRGSSAMTRDAVAALRWASLTVPIQACFIVHRVRLSRRLEFGTIASAGVAGSLSSGIVAIAASAWLSGPAALVAGMLAAAALEGVVIGCRHRWRPGPLRVFPWRRDGARGPRDVSPGLPKGPNRKTAGLGQLTRAGRAMAGTSLLTFAGKNLDNQLVACLLGPEAAGLYVKAFSILMLPWRQLRAPLLSVLRPTLSRADDAAYADHAAVVVRRLAIGSMPIVGWLLMTAPLQVAVLLGPQWTDVVDIYRCLAPVAVLGCVSSALPILTEMRQRPERLLRFQCVSTPIRLGCLAAALPLGLCPAAIVYSMVYVATWFFGLGYCGRGFGDLPRRMAMDVVPIAGLTLAFAWLAPTLTDAVVGRTVIATLIATGNPLGRLTSLVLETSFYVTFWVASFAVSNTLRRDVGQLATAMFRRRSGCEAAGAESRNAEDAPDASPGRIPSRQAAA